MIADPPIRVATPGDAPEIAAMSRDLIEFDLPWGWREARVLRAIQSPYTNVAVVRGPSNLVGFGIMEYWDDDAHLVLFAVHAAHQRRGVGSALLQWLEASARAAGAQRIRVESRRQNVAGRIFYNEHGYHECAIRSRMYSGAVDGVMLEKWLRAASAQGLPDLG